MVRAMSICNQFGCNALIPAPGYCDTHKRIFVKNKFAVLQEFVNPRCREFYNDPKWKRKSIAYRAAHPICEECNKWERTVKSELVHHYPELLILLDNGLDPYDDRYLQALCHNCHQKHLRQKRGRKNG